MNNWIVLSAFSVTVAAVYVPPAIALDEAGTAEQRAEVRMLAAEQAAREAGMQREVSAARAQMEREIQLAQAEVEQEVQRAREAEREREARVEREIQLAQAEVEQEVQRAREAEREREARVEREVEMKRAEMERKLAEAEIELAEAARRVAELSTRNLPRQFYEVQSWPDMRGKPRIGITIETEASHKGPVEGVEVISVTPGSAAADAGLRTGDVLTSVGGQALMSDTRKEANKALMEIVEALEGGDKLDVEYLRDGNVGRVTVEPRVVDSETFVFQGFPSSEDWREDIRVIPGAVGNAVRSFAYRWGGSSWADMELVELNAGLGKYFGTEEGVLVVTAPKSGALELEDGDVIQEIDGRKPSSVNHAIRILSSYQPGEKIELSIMRDKRRRTLDVEMPDDRTSFRIPKPPKPVEMLPVRRVSLTFGDHQT